MAIPFIGKLLDTVVGKGADLISEFITDKDQAAQLEHAFRSQLSAENHEIEKLSIEAERDMQVAQQETIQAELHQSDLYTKRTRPKIATRSFYAGLGYAGLGALPAGGINLGFIVLMPWTFDWQVLMLLYSPALTYMGVRGFEKWKNGMAK